MPEKVSIEIFITRKLYEKIKAAVESGEYATLSEAVRAALRAAFA